MEKGKSALSKVLESLCIHHQEQSFGYVEISSPRAECWAAVVIHPILCLQSLRIL